MAKPIFLSRPSKLPPLFSTEAERFERFLNGHGFVPRRLGGGSYSTKAPLLAVIDLMKQCEGAIILGYPKLCISVAGLKDDLNFDFPTPWNHIEGALAYALQKPTFVIAHSGVEGGVFDYGITGEFVLKTSLAADGWFKTPEFTGAFDDWKQRLTPANRTA
jgi:hypothetical protein